MQQEKARLTKCVMRAVTDRILLQASLAAIRDYTALQAQRNSEDEKQKEKPEDAEGKKEEEPKEDAVETGTGQPAANTAEAQAEAEAEEAEDEKGVRQEMMKRKRPTPWPKSKLDEFTIAERKQKAEAAARKAAEEKEAATKGTVDDEEEKKEEDGDGEEEADPEEAEVIVLEDEEDDEEEADEGDEQGDEAEQRLSVYASIQDWDQGIMKDKRTQLPKMFKCANAWSANPGNEAQPLFLPDKQTTVTLMAKVLHWDGVEHELLDGWAVTVSQPGRERNISLKAWGVFQSASKNNYSDTQNTLNYEYLFSAYGIVKPSAAVNYSRKGEFMAYDNPVIMEEVILVGAATKNNGTLFHSAKVGNVYTIEGAAASTPTRVTRQSSDKETDGSVIGGIMPGGDYVLVGIMRKTFRNDAVGTVQFLTVPSHIVGLQTYDTRDVVIYNANTFLARVTRVEPWDVVGWSETKSAPWYIHRKKVLDEMVETKLQHWRNCQDDARSEKAEAAKAKANKVQAMNVAEKTRAKELRDTAAAAAAAAAATAKAAKTRQRSKSRPRLENKRARAAEDVVLDDGFGYFDLAGGDFDLEPAPDLQEQRGDKKPRKGATAAAEEKFQPSPSPPTRFPPSMDPSEPRHHSFSMPYTRDTVPQRTEAATPEAVKLTQQAFDLAKEGQNSILALATAAQTNATTVNTNSMNAATTANTEKDNMMKSVMANNQAVILALVKGTPKPTVVSPEVQQLQLQQQQQQHQLQMMQMHAYYGAGYSREQEQHMMFNQQPQMPQFQPILPHANPDVCRWCNTPRTTLFCGNCGQPFPTQAQLK